MSDIAVTIEQEINKLEPDWAEANSQLVKVLRLLNQAIGDLNSRE